MQIVKSPLASLLEDIPRLILDYKLALLKMKTDEQRIQDHREYNDKVRKETREYQENFELFKEAKADKNAAQRELNVAEARWAETGVSLDKINELHATSEIYKLVNDIKQPEINNLEDKKDYFEDVTENLQYKTDLIKNNLVTLRNIGTFLEGSGGKGYGDPEKWDESDFTKESLESYLGREVSDIEADYFKTNYHKAIKSLSAFNTEQLLVERREQDIETKDRLNKEDIKTRRLTKTSEFFQRRLANLYSTSGLQDYYTFGNLMQTSGYDDEDLAGFKNNQAAIIKETGEMWGLLIGNHAAAKADPESFFSNYKQIYDLGMPSTQTHSGQKAPGDYADYYNAVEMVHQNYLNSADRIKPLLNEAAKNYLGYREDMDIPQFYKLVKGNYTDYMLAPLQENNQLDDEDLESDFWDNYGN